MLPQDVGRLIATRRRSLGLTQRQVGHAIHRTRAYVSALERGVPWDPDADVLAALAASLAWPTDHILRLVNRDRVPLGGPFVLTPEFERQLKAFVRVEVSACLGKSNHASWGGRWLR